MTNDTAFLDIKGQRVHYKLTGQGKAIILLHGWGGSLDVFKALHHSLEPHFKVIAIDLPGFGKSPEPSTAWGTEEYATMVKDFLEALKIEKPILVGHSYGGRLIIRLGSMIEVSKNILIGSAGIKPQRPMSYYFKVYTFKFLKFLAHLPILSLFLKDAFEQYRNRAGSSDYKNASATMKATLIKAVNEDLTHLLPKVKASSLLIWGENDTATPLRDGKKMEQLIPDAGLVVLKDCGHYCFVEKSQQFLIIVNNFLEKDKTATI